MVDEPVNEPTGDEDIESAAAEAVADPLDTLRRERDALQDRLLRNAAEFDNFRKRSRKDIADAERRVQEDLLRSLLPTFDNLERAVAHAGTAADLKALTEGLKLVMRQFQDTLGSLGIERVATQGKPFDPQPVREPFPETEHFKPDFGKKLT